MSKETEKPEVPETAEPTAAPEPAEELEAMEAPEHEEHHPVKQSSGSTASFLALVIALIAAGGIVYLWQQQQTMRKETEALHQSINRLLTLAEERHTSQQQQIETLAKHRHTDTEEQLGKIEAQVQDLRGRVGQEHREWAVAEVGYLLRVAEHSLTLQRDSNAALSALHEARDLLAKQEQDIYQPVIRQIDLEIDKLSAVSLPDRNRIAAELSMLGNDVESWPLALSGSSGTPPAAPTQQQPAQAPASENGGWRAVLAKIWRDIRSLVSIRHDGETARPLLEPEQRYFLQQNLLLKLEAARLAMLSGNSRAYRDSLSEAAAWLQRYFDTSAPQVSAAQKQIEQLATVDLQPRLPVLGHSIELLRQATMLLRPEQATPQKSPVTSAPAKATEPAPATKAKPGKPETAKAVVPAAKPGTLDSTTATEKGKTATTIQPVAPTGAGKQTTTETNAPATKKETVPAENSNAPGGAAGTTVNNGKPSQPAAQAPAEVPAPLEKDSGQ